MKTRILSDLIILPFPEGHEGWLLVSGDWEEPVGEGMRDELASSVNN